MKIAWPKEIIAAFSQENMSHSVQEWDVRDVVEGCWDREAEEQRPRMFSAAPYR